MVSDRCSVVLNTWVGQVPIDVKAFEFPTPTLLLKSLLHILRLENSRGSDHLIRRLHYIYVCVWRKRLKCCLNKWFQNNYEEIQFSSVRSLVVLKLERTSIYIIHDFYTYNSPLNIAKQRLQRYVNRSLGITQHGLLYSNIDPINEHAFARKHNVD